MKQRFNLLYQDEYLVAIDKPSGLLVHKTGIAPDRKTCMNLLRNQLDQWVYPVHRLDRKTSGVLLFALESETAGKFGELFREHEICKRYLAVVRGWVEEARVIDHALKRDPDREAQEAVTNYRPLGKLELPHAVGPYETARYSLLAVEPVTGRRHQIRRHMNHFSHPVVGDSEHGEGRQNHLFRDKLGIDRLMLHAERVTFQHPWSGKEVQVISEAPAEFQKLFPLFNYTQ